MFFDYIDYVISNEVRITKHFESTTMKKYPITTQRELRRRFWQEHPQLAHLKRRTVDFGNGKQHVADVRVAWCDWLDAMAKSNQISQALLYKATL